MKRVGIIGGIAPESTVDYYRQIIAGYRQRSKGSTCAPVIINSIDMVRMLGMISESRLDELVDFLHDEIGRLARAGADFAVLSSNTPHIAFDAIRSRSPIPMISIVESTAAVATSRGFKRVGLIGTRFTMKAGFYADVFSKRGIAVLLPKDAEQTYIHAKYAGDLVNGQFTGELVNAVFLPETRQEFVKIAKRMVKDDGIEALILGGTELPLLLRGDKETGIPLLDTSAIHVDRILDELLT